jgi:hypothetical protein
MRPRPPGTQVRSAGKVAFQPQPSELKDEVWIRLLLEDYEENSHDAEKNIWFPYSGARSMPTGDSWEGLCRTHWLERSIIARRRPSAMNWPNMPAPPTSETSNRMSSPGKNRSGERQETDHGRHDGRHDAGGFGRAGWFRRSSRERHQTKNTWNSKSDRNRNRLGRG